MAWCPVCKCEYKQGITKCADCKVELVDVLEENIDIFPDFEALQEEEEQISKIAEHVNENLNIHFLDRGADIAGVRKIKQKKDSGVYRNSKELAGENKSSAFILLPVGFLGIVALLLIWFDVIPLYSSVTSKIITSSVMGTLFLVFIGMGIVSLKNAKKFESMATEEGNLTQEIMKYITENYSSDTVDKSIMDAQWEATSEEEKYFKRIECLKMLITKQFMNLEDAYVDFMCDEVYTKLYED